ncbi:MAG TPA: dipeptide ABC transporter ATP-binding protein, partial [Steroidobacteraceae bacterium]|nr:dipeptide ABC transporter ATP-binding protein [Steroidobacteraceae bacterium]
EVSFQTPQSEVHAVRSLSLSVAPGECLSVVGESGAGKSQAFLAILGLLAENGRARGHAWFAGRDLIASSRVELDRIRGARIGMIFQDPMTSLTPHLRVGEQIAEPLVRHRQLSWRCARGRALELLEQAQVTDAARRLHQFPHELSGGMQQRVMIAIALACEPSLLIADEPTTALDVTIQAQILSLLAELKRKRGLSMVLITHDLGAVAGLADRVAVMQAGSLLEIDSAHTILTRPQHPYTQELLKAVPRLDAAGPAGTDSEGPVTLQAADVRVQFEVRTSRLGRAATLHALLGVDVQLHAGEALGIVGESGSGKSTLARAVLRLLRPQSGSIAWLGRSIESLPGAVLRPLRSEVQIIFQDPLASLDPRRTAGESIAEALQVHRPEMGAAQRLQTVHEAMLRVGLAAELLNRYPHELSGGQCQRVGIARALVLRPRVLVCDEAVSALDVSVQAQILRLLAELKRDEGLSILFISHNLAVVKQLCDCVLVLYLGRMMELGRAGSLFGRALHPYTRELMAAAPTPDPAVQPGRLLRILAGEPPSQLALPSGCVYRTRCAHAIEICRERLPAWEEGGAPRQRVACHRWRELAALSDAGD